MQADAAAIDIDAIPLDLPAKRRRPIGMAYLATVWPLPGGRVVLVPHYGPDGRPTLAHGLRGQKPWKGTSSGAAVGDVGERGASGATVA